MSSEITFSTEYLDTLKKMLKVVADLPNKQHALIVKLNENKVVHSSMAVNTFVYISTTTQHANFQDNEIGITNLSEFLNYAKAIEYPEKETKIYLAKEKTTKKKDISSFKFEGQHATYRMPLADALVFNNEYARKTPTYERNTDPMELVGKFYLDTDDLKRLVNDIQLMGKLDAFGLAVNDNKITIYMRNVQNQQVTKVLDSIKSKVFNNYTTVKSDDSLSCKLFPHKIFTYMSYFECDFEIEMRIVKRNNKDIMAIKAYGTVDFSSKNKKKIKILKKDIKKDDKQDDTSVLEVKKDPIDIYIGTTESSAHACSANMFEIVI